MQKNISQFIKNSKVQVLTLLLGSALVSSCATSPDEAAKKIQTGMNKSEIIEIMGNPDHADRVHGSDRWIYDATGERTKPIEVYFNDGKVALFGKPVPPVEKAPAAKGSFKTVPAEKGFKPVPVEKTEPGK